MNALIQDPVAVLAVLLTVLATLFGLQKTAPGKRVFAIVPALLFCYFVPTLLSNTGIIPQEKAFALYKFTKAWLLPASLFLLVLAVDFPAIFGLGRNMLLLFATAFVSIILAGPLAFWILQSLFDGDTSAEAWKGLAALSGSWIGGGANMTTIQQSVGASDSILGVIIVVDVFVAEIWTAVLFWFAGRERQMDAKIQADRASLDTLREKVESYQAATKRPTDMTTLLIMLALAFGGTVIAHHAGQAIHDAFPIGSDGLTTDIFGAFAWKVILITVFGLALSFTKCRDLEGAGASSIGSVMLYLLVATIGAKASFSAVLQPENLPLVAVGALWMILHVAAMLVVRRLLRAPIFFAAIGSRACIGGAASSPIVAAAFNPALVPVGVMLAILGYVVGTFGGLTCAKLLELVHLYS